MSESNLVAHARRELEALNMSDTGPQSPSTEMSQSLIALVSLFADQDHCGSSAAYAIGAFTKLASYEPLSPLQGTDNEWAEVSKGVLQNKRCGRVFKQADRYEGQAYDIEGIIWRDKDGSTFVNHMSHTPITFPYTPTSVYRDRI